MTSPEAEPEPGVPSSSLIIAWMRIFGLGLAFSGLYVLAVLAMAAFDGQSFESVMGFHPDRTPMARWERQVASDVAVMSAVGFLFVAPGVLGTIAMKRWPARSASAHVLSLFINTLALMFLFWLLRASGGLNRSSFVVGWTFWTITLAILAFRAEGHRTGAFRRFGEWKLLLAIGLVFVLASVGCFFPEQFLQCFNEDGTEAYELARSLHSFAIPTWEIETDTLDQEVHYGPVVVNPSLINSYWTSAFMVLLGNGELATRLPYWVWWMAVYIVSLRLIELARSQAIDWLDGMLVGLLMFLVSVLFSFYVGYNPYMADLANPGVTNALFTLTFLMMAECLLHGDRLGFAASAVMASLVFYSGVVMLGLILAAAWFWKPIPRKDVRRWAGLPVLLLALIAGSYAVYGATRGVLSLWFDALDVEYVSDYLAPVPRWQSAPLFLGYFALGSGGVAVWGLVRAYRQGPWQRTVATATCGYLVIVLMSGFKNLHYLGPLFPIPLVLWLASLPGGRWKLRIAIGCSLLLCVGLSWPLRRAAFTLNRELGEQTTFATDSYPEAIQWARLRYGLQASHALSWDCDQHTWVAYARLDRQTNSPRPLIVSESPPLSGEYQLLALGGQHGTQRAVRLDTRDPKLRVWLRSQNPLQPRDRYPPIFRPLAEGRFSPHRNFLE